MMNHAGERPTAFMIFATQRTGSNWLMGTLDNHPSIASYDELLDGDGSDWGRQDLEFFKPYCAHHRGRDLRLGRARWLFRYLNKLYSPRAGIEAVGMKLMYNQLWHNASILIYIIWHRVRIVHLVRANRFDILLSEETAEARQRYHAWQGDDVETPAVTLDPKKVVSWLRTLEFRVWVARTIVSLLPIKHIEVSYEELTADPTLIYGVLSFLGFEDQPDPSSLTSAFRKLNTNRRSELVENYDEIERALKGTRFERFLLE